MIDVKIIENNGLVALCNITGDEYEFRQKIRGSEEFLFDFEDRHTEDCELAEELGE